jgi:hypothetical protein
MFKMPWSIILALVVGLGIGLMLNRNPSLPAARAQDVVNADQPNKVLVQGHGRAASSLRPPGEQFALSTSDAPRSSFKVIPLGKQFILTDVMYETQGSVRQNLTVNIANANIPTNKHNILFQVSLDPGKSDHVHLCSGYLIPAGNTLVAFTNAGLDPEQYVSVSVTGYLVDQ